MRITSRSEWGANPLNTPADLIEVPAPELWLHHTGGDGHGAHYMRALQSSAIAGGYVDLEYTYVADTDGTAFMSRGPGHNTAATGGGHNDVSHAVCAMGNYQTLQPTDALLDTIVALARELYAGGWSRTRTFTGPHRDASGNSTACCGVNLIARIDDINREITTGVAPPMPTPSGGGTVSAVRTPSGRGYYVCDSTGAVFAYGDAHYCGGANALKLAAPVTGIDVTPTNRGYVLCAEDGGTFGYGDGNTGKGAWSMAGHRMNAPVVGIQLTETGKGLWLFGADGGVFAFGDAEYLGAPTGMVH